MEWLGVNTLNPIYQFEVHTKTKMYSIIASYFVANQDGVLFFDEQNRGIGFAPDENLDFVRLAPPKPIDTSELFRGHNEFVVKR